MWWRFPYTNFHELNLDWVIQKIKDFSNEIDNVNNTIKESVNAEIKNLIDSGYFEDIIDSELLDGLNEKVNLLYDRNVIIIGDSYATYEDSWNIRLQNIMQPNTCYQFNKGGCGFGKKNIDGNTPTKLLSDNSGKVTNKSEINMIIVAMGANDIIYNEDISNGFEEFRTYCNINYPNATIYIGAIGNTLGTQDGSFSAATPANYYTMVTTYQNMSRYKNCKYLKLSEMALINPEHFQADGIHPNSDGSNHIASVLFYSLINSERIEEIHTLELVNGSNIWSPETGVTFNGNIILKVSNGVIVATTNKANITIPSTSTKLNDLDIKLGTLKHPLMKGITNGQKRVLLPGYLNGLTAGSNSITAALTMQGEELHLRASFTGSGTTTGVVTFTQGYGTFNYLS